MVGGEGEGGGKNGCGRRRKRREGGGWGREGEVRGREGEGMSEPEHEGVRIGEVPMRKTNFCSDATEITFLHTQLARQGGGGGRGGPRDGTVKNVIRTVNE